MLFNKRLLHHRMEHFAFPTGDRFDHIKKTIASWQKALKDSDLDKTKETSVQGFFLQKFFEEILGYATQVSGSDVYHLIQHPKTEVDAKEADGALGFFSKDKSKHNYRAVIELKDAKTPLDKKQVSRKENYTPVEQAFGYLSKFDRCDWVIVSNFREIRLYHKSRGQLFYERFDVLELHEDKYFKPFYYLLCQENLLDPNRNAPVDQLVKDTSGQEEDISKAFYQEFKEIRLKLFHHVVEHNPAIDKKLLLEKTQKLLDRLIFVLFCEDSGLLPSQIFTECYTYGIRSRERSEQRVWREFRNLFMDINEGRDDVEPAINAYDGGLFADDEILNNLVILDDIWKDIVKLSRYDFDSDLNVNILGHIFEQSLSDLEKLKASLDGVEVDNNTAKRKKEGIYYTPEYITRYIVEQTVGRYLEDHPDKLETVKILDPACGSGAFLNQAHAYVREQYQVRFEEKIAEVESRRALNVFEHMNQAAIDSGILLNNLYGVDLNEESAEITKLSLWLKTAKKSEPLQNLDANIKCGNSLISDPAFAGDKAFDWNVAFPEIMAGGGFDVVIGNPPYVRQELISDVKPYLEKQYDVYHGVADLYVYFFEKGLKLLKEGGYFSIIVSNKFLKAGYGRKLTQYLQKKATLIEIVDFGDLQIFEGATTYPCIITIQKKQPNEMQWPMTIQLQTLEQIAELKAEVRKNGYQVKIGCQDEEWLLGNPAITDLFGKIKKFSVPLDDYVNGRIYYGVKTGLNEAFVIDKATRDRLILEHPKSEEVIKPFLAGRDVKRYQTLKSDQYLIYIPWHFPLHHDESIAGSSEKAEIEFKKHYPSVYNHLLRYKEKLEARNKAETGIRYEWYALQRCAATYYQEFEKSKIVYAEIAIQGQFSLDEKSFYCDTTAYILGSSSLYLLGLLNSKLITALFKHYSAEIRGGFLRWKRQYMKDLPICSATLEQQESLGAKAERMMIMTRELSDQTQWSLDLLQAEYGLETIPQKLGKFYELGWNLFVEELEKKKLKLTLAHKEELMKWFRDKQGQLQGLAQEIAALDRAIDQEVYALYGLTAEEIQLVDL